MHTSSSRPRSLARALLATALSLTVVLAGATLSPASAVAGPTGLSPNGGTVSGTPVFSWDPLGGATEYDVEIYDGATKLTSASVSNTQNIQWVPTAYELPTGKLLTWRVRGLVSGIESDWSQSTFTRGAVSAPTLTNPADNTELLQPGDPLIYRWNAVPGAVSYTVQVGPDQSFVDPNLVTSYTTSGTSLAPNVIPDNGIYYWRVTANLKNGVKSALSAVRSYQITAVIRSGGDATLPGLPQAPTNNSTIEDVVLDWHPIDGAATYKLQVSTDSNFLTKVVDASGIHSTRYSPTTTLDNDQYWWRIASVNADGYQTPWESSPIWQFTRRWDDQPHLLYPADGATVGNPLYFQWTPTQLASRYTLDVSTSSSFSPAGAVESCGTVHTTFTPSDGASDCWPGAAGTYYWRVRAFDDPAAINSEVVLGEVHSFTYQPDLVSVIAPTNGATVQIPTFSWDPYEDASKYRVTITNVGTGSSVAKTTVTTTFTWPTKLTDGATYRWMVQPVWDDGRIGAGILAGSQPTFTAQNPAAPTGPNPEPTSVGTSGPRPPLLTWTPVTGATSYKILVRPNGSTGGYSSLGTYAYPSGSDTDGLKLSPGSYEWMVEAYDGSTFLSASTTTLVYSIAALGQVTGYRAAMTGATSGSAATSCAATLPSSCQNLRQTPVLRWDPLPGAAYYKIYIANDVNLTNLVQTVTVRGTSMWMRTAALPDADAGTAYFWLVIACGPTDICMGATPATHQFNKQGAQVTLQEPLSGTQPNDIQFTWTDYLATVLSTDGGVGLSTPAGTEARQYRIQVSDSLDFSNLLDNKVVDQRTYTPYDRTYPEQTLYWRVQAIDGSSNSLPWSETGVVGKVSPKPQLNLGHNGVTFNGSPTLGWAPLAYAKSYHVQIFTAGANVDTGTPVSQLSGQKQNSYTPSVPLAKGNYKWRVRRIDADSRYGDWSALGTFTIGASAPTLVAPADGVEVLPRQGLFSWQAAPGTPVASYRVALTRNGVTTNTSTIATAFAPTTRLANGDWTWNVTAVDSEGADIATSPDRSFVVDGTLTPTAPITITGSGKVGTVLTTQPVSWNKPGTTSAYQWYRGTTAIPGANQSTYLIDQIDFGKAMKVRVFGVNGGYDGSVGTDSNTISAVAGNALITINNATYTGTRTVGSTLTANPGTWASEDEPSTALSPTFKYQWLRGGGAISGATGKTYKLVPTDAARSISVRVTASKTGYAPGTSTSPSGVIAKIASTTTIRLKAIKIKRGTRGTVYVTVTAALPETGTIRIYDGARLIKSVTLTVANAGRKTIVLPILVLGKHSLQARYLGNTQIRASNSARVTLSVVR